MSEQLEAVQWDALHERTGDGLEVSLLWNAANNAVKVRVEDRKTEGTFEVPVDAGMNPMDVFNHPFAYAAQVEAQQAA